MSESPLLLCYGRDLLLLETRRLVLQGAGFEVLIVTDPAAFAEMLLKNRIDLVILCHSLSAEQCQQALTLAHAQNPPVSLLLLEAGRHGCEGGLVDEVLCALDGPNALLSTVEKITGEETAPVSS